MDLAAEPSLSAGSWGGLDFAVLRYLGMGLAGLFVLGATLVLFGLPVRWMLRPVTWPIKLIFGRSKPAAKPL